MKYAVGQAVAITKSLSGINLAERNGTFIKLKLIGIQL